MKRILLPALPGSVMLLPFRTVLSFAGRFGSSITVKLYQPRSDEHAVDPMSWGLTGFVSQEGMMESELERAWADVKSALAAETLSSLAGTIGVDDGPLLTWRDLGRIARVYDVVAVSRGALSEHVAIAIEQLLFESGRPMLLLPVSWPRSVGDCVAIAWNRSTETARLVGHTVDMLRRAREVHVIDIEDWYVEGPDGRQLASYLEANDVPVHLHAVHKGAGEFGGRILSEAHRVGADLLLKGAYTQSRLTQVIFGGATRDILQDAHLPVLFAH